MILNFKQLALAVNRASSNKIINRSSSSKNASKIVRIDTHNSILLRPNLRLKYVVYIIIYKDQ